VLHYPHRQYLAPRVRVVVDALLGHFASIDDLRVMPSDLAQYAAVPAEAEASARQSASLRRKTSRSGWDAAAS
jgi:hypothetical protein